MSKSKSELAIVLRALNVLTVAKAAEIDVRVTKGEISGPGADHYVTGFKHALREMAAAIKEMAGDK